MLMLGGNVQRIKTKTQTSRPLKVEWVTRAICTLDHSGKSLPLCAEACMAFAFPITPLEHECRIDRPLDISPINIEY